MWQNLAFFISLERAPLLLWSMSKDKWGLGIAGDDWTDAWKIQEKKGASRHANISAE